MYRRRGSGWTALACSSASSSICPTTIRCTGSSPSATGPAAPNIHRPTTIRLPAPIEVCLEVWNDYGRDTFCRTVTIDDATAIEDPDRDKVTVTLRPNPTDGPSTLSWSRSLGHQATLKVIAPDGTVHSVQTIEAGHRSVELDDPGAPGLYIVQIRTEAGLLAREKWVVY